MKVSIITVVYNNAKTIVSAIESVLAQRYTNREYIIIDGGSTDGTLAKIAAYGDQIDMVLSEPDHGIFEAMNKGLSMATGDVIAFLNSDDFYADNHVIEKVVELMHGNDVDAVFGDLHYVRSDNIRKVFRYWKSGVYKTGSFLYGWMPPHPAFFVKKHVYDRYGKFNTGFKIAADYELMLRFLHINKINVNYLPQVLVKMRTGGVSNSGLKNRFLANLEDRKAWAINGVKPYFFTLYLKPFRKVLQVIMAQSPGAYAPTQIK
jgi:glycosyltransferase involved in cell wall biosynthesis